MSKLKSDPESIRIADGGILPVDERLKEELKNLREDVESQGCPKVKLINNNYREVKLEDIRWKHIGWMKFGYMVKDNGACMIRRVFIVTPGVSIMEVPEKERNAIAGAVFEVFLDYGHGDIEVESPHFDCILFSQEFMVTHWIERNPNVRVPNDPKYKYKDTEYKPIPKIIPRTLH